MMQLGKAAIRSGAISRGLVMLTCFASIGGPQVLGQAIIINSAGNQVTPGMPIDRRFAQIEPTKVTLPEDQINARGHQDILRALTAEQGFAMRPLPRGKKGLVLVANGKLSPSNEGYLKEVTEKGLSVKPGDRVVFSNVRIERDRLIFDINGGPEHKHNILRHVQIGAGGGWNNVVQDNGEEPTGSRLTLTFSKYVPDLTPAQVKALLAPLISFDVKTPVQAYTDTLPPKLKEAILNHRVMVGMNTDMVLFALGQPEKKSREIEGQMPFEEWIYGHPPQDVNFVRVNGNRVIRVEIAKLGQPLEIFTTDEVQGMLMTDGRTVTAAENERATHTIQLGDVHPDLDKQAPLAPPSLRAPGETLPADTRDAKTPADARAGQMRPVVFPKKDTTHDPANTVSAHPAPPPPPDEADSALKPKPEIKTEAKPDPAPDPESALPPSPPASSPSGSPQG